MNLSNQSNYPAATKPGPQDKKPVGGRYINQLGERFYEIKNAGKMKNFLMTIVSDCDHWLFVASNGGISAGRSNPGIVLFPYITVDKIYDSVHSTGPLTLMFIKLNNSCYYWQPFSTQGKNQYRTEKRIYKNIPGNKVIFRENNLDLNISYSYMWSSSEKYGFIKQSFLENHNPARIEINLLDGVKNIMPAQVDPGIQLSSSCLSDAYKQNELDQATGMAVYGMASQITDRAIPMESLRANIAWATGLPEPVYLISDIQIPDFISGQKLQTETHKNGLRGAYFVNSNFKLDSTGHKEWLMTLDVYLSQSQTVLIRDFIRNEKNIPARIQEDISKGTVHLKKIAASADGLQITNSENTTAHHFSNVIFNCMRGGVFANDYQIDLKDLKQFIKIRNTRVYQAQQTFFNFPGPTISREKLIAVAKESGNPDLIRLCLEYLPLIFSRRHGDPSRPWNHFDIRIKDEQNNMIFNYQGNWRDIFQNWEALSLSYPCFIENMLAKFVNASTIDGYNPYRMTKQGIDWEKINPEDPWSNIGYWGDHQVIYLLKFLEWQQKFFPGQLEKLLTKEIFSYAHVPYKILAYEQILKDPYHTIAFDDQLEKKILKQSQVMGTDAKLYSDDQGRIYHVNLTEKLLVLTLSKLANFVPGGGIWMNTQRPEWNDANNALTGYGLSMVTLYYLKRFLKFMTQLFRDQKKQAAAVSSPVIELFDKVAEIFMNNKQRLTSGIMTDKERKNFIDCLQYAGSDYRCKVYEQGLTGKASFKLSKISSFFENILPAIDHTIELNQRQDGLYQAYNLIHYTEHSARVKNLSEMLEGQVAVLSASTLEPEECLAVLKALRQSSLFRPDQYSYLLYPDRKLAGFFDKNRIAPQDVAASKVLTKLAERGPNPVISRDEDGTYRFGSDCFNARELEKQLAGIRLDPDCPEITEQDKQFILELYEKVFQHHSFTGRSGAMYAYEGLGSIYWHMVSKLLLAVQENYFTALENGAGQESLEKLAAAYYDIRAGIGFNKTPQAYGGFPADPYSHTPAHAGAQQPGMTGQVKEEVITRLGELGVRINQGCICFNPSLLRKSELLLKNTCFTYAALNSQLKTIDLLPGQLGFTFCQVPIVYIQSDHASIEVLLADGTSNQIRDIRLDAETSKNIFKRTGLIARINVQVTGLLE